QHEVRVEVAFTQSHGRLTPGAELTLADDVGYFAQHDELISDRGRRDEYVPAVRVGTPVPRERKELLLLDRWDAHVLKPGDLGVARRSSTPIESATSGSGGMGALLSIVLLFLRQVE